MCIVLLMSLSYNLHFFIAAFLYKYLSDKYYARLKYYLKQKKNKKILYLRVIIKKIYVIIYILHR